MDNYKVGMESCSFIIFSIGSTENQSGLLDLELKLQLQLSSYGVPKIHCLAVCCVLYLKMMRCQLWNPFYNKDIQISEKVDGFYLSKLVWGS